MKDRPTVQRLVWDEWNVEHIQKHDVTEREAEEVVAGSPILQPSYKGRFAVIGPTAHGRMLTVVIGPVPREPGSFYVFSARPASRRERAEFRSWSQG